MSTSIRLALLLTACITASAHAISLGTAASFAVLGGSTVTNTGPSILTGDLGLTPGSAVTGFPPGTITGATQIANAIAISAQSDASDAFTILGNLPVTQSLTGQDLGGLTLTPGVYSYDTTAQLTGILTLDGQNQLNPLFVFLIGSTLTTADHASIVQTNGTSADNIYFHVGSSATLGTDTAFAGNLMAFTSDTLTTGATVEGRVIALHGAVTLDSNLISIPRTNAVPEPSALSLLALPALTLLRRR